MSRYAGSLKSDGSYFVMGYALSDIQSGRTDFDPLLAALRYPADPSPEDQLSRLLFCVRWCRHA